MNLKPKDLRVSTDRIRVRKTQGFENLASVIISPSVKPTGRPKIQVKNQEFPNISDTTSFKDYYLHRSGPVYTLPPAVLSALSNQ